MSHSTLSLITRLAALSSVVARAQVSVVAAASYFYGYWFSRMRA